MELQPVEYGNDNYPPDYNKFLKYWLKLTDEASADAIIRNSHLVAKLENEQVPFSEEQARIKHACEHVLEKGDAGESFDWEELLTEAPVRIMINNKDTI